MNLSCPLGRHSAVPSDVRNLGLGVSQCRCCGRDMIHKSGRWTTVPRGFRIVWRRLDEVIADAVPLRLVRNLPVLSRDARRHSLLDLTRRAADMADLVRSGIRVAGWGFADRCRALRASLLEPLQRQQLVLPL
jgi:hypothetical protein